MNNLNNMNSLFLNNEKIEISGDKQPNSFKISNKIVACDIENNIIGTSEYISNIKNNGIKDIEFKEKKIHKRIFYKNTNEVGYIEVFQDPSLAYAHQICENITFLFESNGKNSININENRCFGFRYYNLKNSYCTLLKENEENGDDYFFLEKLVKINNENNIFYKPELDCFEIIFEAIFSKYRKEKKTNDFPLILEAPIYEILGFSYSIISKSTENFKFHKPHSINILNDADFTSHINKQNNMYILNIMPLLFDGHISILFFLDNNGKRFFRLSDPSHVHSKYNGNSCFIDPFLFPLDMRKNFDLCPKKKIQKFNSCTLWFYFQLLTLLNYKQDIQNKKYSNAEDFVICTDNNILYYDCLNYYTYIMGFQKKLIEIKPKSLYEEEDSFYIVQKTSKRLDNIKINIFSFLNQFVDIIEIIELLTYQNLSFKPGINQLKDFLQYNEEFIDFISLLNYNLNFFDLNIKRDEKIIIQFETILEEIKDLRNSFIKNCLDFLVELAKIDRSVKSLVEYDSKEAINVNVRGRTLWKILEEINTKVKLFNEKKNQIENEYNLYPLKITEKILFPIIGVLYRSK